jgi:RND family efflux transporter MFP subunit
MGRVERLQHARATTRRAILDAALELFIADGYAQVSIRNIAAKVEYSPGAIYSYFASKDEIFFALAEEGFRQLGARQFADTPGAEPLDEVRATAWRLYEFSKEQPQYFALVFLDRHVPRVSQEYEQFAFISELRNRAIAQVQRCIEQEVFPPTTNALVALRLLFAPIFGIAALRLSLRLSPLEDADALARDAIETTLAGLRAGAPKHAAPSSEARGSTPDVSCPAADAKPSRIARSTARTIAALVLAAGLVSASCGTATGESSSKEESAALAVSVAAAIEQPITRFLKVTGTLAAEEAAEVAAETQGRVIATPVERGTRVAEGSELIRISPTEAQAQAAEAEANAAQLEGRLGLTGGRELDIDNVPEVANARATLTLAQGDFERARMLFERKLLSQAEFDQRSAQLEVARRQAEIARNGAVQQYQALLAARARVVLARKALADTVVKAPFAGVVGQRLVSAGDYVTRGTKVASVLRTSPLRVQLTVPEQFSAEVAVGRPVSFEVDASPGQTFTGQVRYVSPALEANSRTLVVEAVVPNDSGTLRPGAFATARIEQASRSPGVMVPAAAVRTVTGTSRVFVVSADRVEERIVTVGQQVGDLVEITTGLKAGERVVTSGVAQLADGLRVTAK